MFQFSKIKIDYNNLGLPLYLIRLENFFKPIDAESKFLTPASFGDHVYIYIYNK